MTLRTTPLLALGLLLLGVGPSHAAGPPSAREVLAGTVLEPELDELLRGETVVVQAHEASPREMTMALACIVPPDREVSLAPFRNGDPLVPDGHESHSGRIGHDDPEAGLAGVTLGSAKEARRYLDAKAGWDLSLSAEEIAAFGGLDPAPGQEVAAVDAELRRRLAARVRDFHARGLAGVAAFDRGKGEVSAIDEDLRHSTVVSESLRRVLPAIHSALLADRLEVPGGRPVEYFWSNVSVQDRPVLLLTQRADARVGDSAAVIERRFYASWFMGAGQAIALRIPVEEGTLFAYVDHSFVDRWSGPGFTTAGKRKIGLKLAGETLKKAVGKATTCQGG